MFVIFDSSNRVFDRLITTTTTKPFNIRQHIRENFPPGHPVRYLGRRAIQPVHSEDRYPTFGIDIPNSCNKSFRIFF